MLFNPERDSVEALEKQSKSINLKARILNMPFIDLKHLALATAKSEGDIKTMYQKSEHEIRHYMMRQADSNAAIFDLNLTDPVLIKQSNYY